MTNVEFASSPKTTARAMQAPTSERPYQPRQLSLAEIRAGDVHSFSSPKEGGRLTRVVGIPALAQALLLEFDSNIDAFTERPRTLRCGTHVYEITFWCRERNGRERMLLLVSTASATRTGTGRRRHREAEALIDAAAAAHLPLEFVHESDLLARQHEIARAFRWLPAVQTAQRLANRLMVQNAILDMLSCFHRMRLSQITSALEGYSSADVQCVLADLAHQGVLVCDAVDRMRRSTVFERRLP